MQFLQEVKAELLHDLAVPHMGIFKWAESIFWKKYLLFHVHATSFAIPKDTETNGMLTEYCTERICVYLVDYYYWAIKREIQPLATTWGGGVLCRMREAIHKSTPACNCSLRRWLNSQGGDWQDRQWLCRRLHSVMQASTMLCIWEFKRVDFLLTVNTIRSQTSPTPQERKKKRACERDTDFHRRDTIPHLGGALSARGPLWPAASLGVYLAGQGHPCTATCRQNISDHRSKHTL